MVAKTLEKCDTTLRAKEAQLIEALDHLQTLEGRIVTETRELRLELANLYQRHYAQEDEGKKLAATVEDMWMGIGLDFETVINTPAFKEIQMHQLQFGSK